MRKLVVIYTFKKAQTIKLNFELNKQNYSNFEKNIYEKSLEYLKWTFDHFATWSKVLGMLKVLQNSVDGWMVPGHKYLKDMMCFGKGVYTDGFYWWIYILLKRSETDATKEIES